MADRTGQVIDLMTQTCVPVGLFPYWNVLLVKPNQEEKDAIWLREHDIVAYWPNFPKQERKRGRQQTGHRLRSVMPGLLFVPIEFLSHGRRDEILRYYTHSYGFLMSPSGPTVLTKADVEVIRDIEAKLNLPPAKNELVDAGGKKLKVGQSVRFLNEQYAAFLGQGVVKVLAAPTRVGIEVVQLFGSRRIVFVPAAEIEVL